MLFLARKNLFQEKTRLFISVGGVAFSVMLMIILQGLSIGISNVIGQYFESVPADLWVAHASTGNIMDTSILPLSVGSKLEKVSGVSSVKSFGLQSLTTTVNGKTVNTYLVSYDPSMGAGQPPKAGQGKTAPGKGEMIIDRTAAKSNHIKLGDRISFVGRKLNVVGFSEGTFMLSSSIAFVNQQDASVYSLPGTTNYWLVRLKPGADVSQVQASINQIPSVYAHTKGHFIEVNNDAIKNVVQPIFGALVVLGALIGTAVIGLTIFVATIEKAKEYGVLKAIGLKNRQLYTIVMQQAFTAAIMGYIVGAALALVLNPIITNAVPQFVTKIRVIDMGWIFALTIVMAAVASYIPMRRLNKIDPAEVFNS